MLVRFTWAVFFLVFLSGCRAVDGTYLPGCPAFAGDRIELNNERFVWDKFTDEVKIDDAGNRIDPFPGYPKTGTYSIADNRIVLTFENGADPQVFHLLGSRGQPELFTDTQFAEWKKSNNYPECVLTLVRDDG